VNAGPDYAVSVAEKETGEVFDIHIVALDALSIGDNTSFNKILLRPRSF
jgi:hypothetical protein